MNILFTKNIVFDKLGKMKIKISINKMLLFENKETLCVEFITQ